MNVRYFAAARAAAGVDEERFDLADGARKTYSNKCVACSDTNVLGYTANACAPETPPQ